MDNDDIDVIYACLDWRTSEQRLSELLRCNKPMLLEKPIGTSSIIVESALKGIKPENKLVGMNRRFYPTIRRLRNRVGDGGLRAAHITVSEDVGRLVRILGADIVPHILAYSSCHLIDVALHVFGELSIKHIHCYEEVGTAAGFHSFNGALSTTDNVPVSLSINANDPVNVGIRCLFDDNTSWDLTPMETLSVYDGYDIVEPTLESPTRSYVPRRISQSAAHADGKPGILEQSAAFLSGNHGPAAQVGDALKLLRFIESLRTESTT